VFLSFLALVEAGFGPLSCFFRSLFRHPDRSSGAVCRGGAEGPRQDLNLFACCLCRVADRGGPFFFTLRAPALHIFSGASIPKSPNANTNCLSTNSVNPSSNARFFSSASDKIWCL